MRYEVEVGGTRREVQVTRQNGRYDVVIGDRRWSIDVATVGSETLSLLLSDADGAASGGVSEEIVLAANPGLGTWTARVDGVPIEFNPNSRSRRRGEAAHGDGPQRLVAPMPGKVVRVLVKPGDTVTARQPLVVIEAMKMENELRAVRDGIVGDVHAQEGQLVDAGTLLLMVSPG